MSEAKWYAHKHKRIQGPFTTDEIHRFLRIGRLRVTDKVWTRRGSPEPIHQVPELIPESMLPDLGVVG